MRPLKASGFWAQTWNDPTVGLAALYMSFGDDQVLGHAIAVLPLAEFNLFTRKKTSLRLTNGFGLARLSKTFNEVNNPTNNAIGSHFNNVSKLGLAIHHDFGQVGFFLGGDFTHFSNGGSQSPNSGINVITGVIGFKRNFNTKQEKQKAEYESVLDSVSFKKSGFNLNWHYGFYEDDVPNGPKYPIQAISGAWYRQFSPRYRILFGLEYEHNSANYHFAKNTFQSESDARRQAKQVILLVANEFYLVNYSFRFQTGFYTNHPSNFGNGAFYFKLISQYHFDLTQLPFGLSVGVMMKSHWAKAENIGLVFGIDF